MPPATRVRCPVNRSIDPATAQQGIVRRIHNRIHRQCGKVGPDDGDFFHGDPLLVAGQILHLHGIVAGTGYRVRRDRGFKESQASFVEDPTFAQHLVAHSSDNKQLIATPPKHRSRPPKFPVHPISISAILDCAPLVRPIPTIDERGCGDVGKVCLCDGRSCVEFR